MCFPILANLISGNANTIRFVVDASGAARAMTFWDAVYPNIAQLSVMLGHEPMRVVADAYFAKAPFINWMLGISIHVITRMRRDAAGWDDATPEPLLPPGKKKRGRPWTNPRKGEKWKLADLVKSFPTEYITVFIYGKLRAFHVVTRDIWMRFAIQQIFRDSACEASFHNSGDVPEEIFRLIA